jgi:hypothetical protein
MNTSHLPNIDPADRTLIETAIELRFDLHALRDPASPHPAQHSFLSLAIWINQPHIQAATDIYLAAIHRAACCAHSLDIATHIAGLKSLFLTAIKLLQQTSDLPSDPLQAPKAARDLRSTIREARLISAALKSLTRPPRTPSPRRAKTSISSPHHTNHSTDLPPDTSTDPSTISSAAPTPLAHPSTPNQAHAPTNRNASAPDLATSINHELNLLRSDLADLHSDWSSNASNPAESLQLQPAS